MKTLAELLCPETPLQTGCNQLKAAGDLVMIGSNHGPVFEIVHVHGEMAWVRPVKNGQEGLVHLDRLRSVEAEARN